jgi:hypothetical protein
MMRDMDAINKESMKQDKKDETDDEKKIRRENG